MKLVLLPILTAATIIPAAVVPSPLVLNLIANPTIQSQPSIATLTSSLLQTPNTNLSLRLSDFPDRRFKAAISMGAPYIPINSVLMNVLYLMSIVSDQDFTQKLQPRTYSTPGFRNIEIASYAWTEARFLIWGVYSAATWMIKYARPHEMNLDLFWEDRLVGRMKIAAKRALSLTGGAVQVPAAQSDGEDTDGSVSVVGNLTDSDLAASMFNTSAALPNAPDITITFEEVSHASHVERNDLFLTFCTYSPGPNFLSLDPNDESSRYALRLVRKTSTLQTYSKARRNPSRK